MNSNSETVNYRLQAFGLSTINKAAINYYCVIVDLPIATNANGDTDGYNVSPGAVTNNILNYSFSPKEGYTVQDPTQCSTYKMPLFLTQWEDVSKKTPFTISGFSVTGSYVMGNETIPVASSSSSIKKSSLFETPGATAVSGESTELYHMRHQFLDQSAAPAPVGYSIVGSPQFLVLFSKIASPAEAPNEKELYVMANGTSLFCTSIPKTGTNPVKNTTSENIVAAHLLKCDGYGEYTEASFEGVPYPPISITPPQA
tara:strand:- start:24358 stop:25128 length:771 start_codon:yes stop_codon:yes gene_type:complete